MAYYVDMTPEQEREYLNKASIEQLAGYLAARAKRSRNMLGESQEAFACRAGISLRTYKRFERDGSTALETFLKVLVALERVQGLSLLFPSEPHKRLSPLEKLESLRPKKS